MIYTEGRVPFDLITKLRREHEIICVVAVPPTCVLVQILHQFELLTVKTDSPSIFFTKKKKKCCIKPFWAVGKVS